MPPNSLFNTLDSSRDYFSGLLFAAFTVEEKELPISGTFSKQENVLTQLLTWSGEYSDCLPSTI